MLSHTVAFCPDRNAVTWEYLLSSHPNSVGQARRQVRYALEPYADLDLLERVQLVVSELVTNAVRHAPGKLITLRLAKAANGVVSGEVVDQGGGAIAVRDQAVGGLGLPIVDAVTSDWGIGSDSAQVWFRFDPRKD